MANQRVFTSGEKCKDAGQYGFICYEDGAKTPEPPLNYREISLKTGDTFPEIKERNRLGKWRRVYRILSLDGGGIKGLFTATLLDRIVGKWKGFLKKIDLVAGTSTGGIIALALARGVSPKRLVRLYEDRGKNIFDDSWLDDVLDLFTVVGAEYDNKNLAKELKSVLGDRTTLADLGKHVVIPSFDLDNEAKSKKRRMWKPKFFHNFSGGDSDGDELAMDVALATSAAPTYFPAHNGYIDGGVVANNPAMAALAQALDPKTGDQQLVDIRLLSIGTGTNTTYIDKKDLNWGYAQWVKPLVELMIDGNMGVADFQCRQLLGERYHRLDMVLPQRIKMDDPSKVRVIKEYAARLSFVKKTNSNRYSLVTWMTKYG